MAVKSYASPAAFHAALEARVRDLATATRRPLNRVRTLLVMERFLARIASTFPESTVLKGGLALELRLARARTTRDIDLRLVGAPAAADGLLVAAAAFVPDPDDFLRFRVVPNAEHPTMEGEGVVYEGRRFDARASIAGRAYGDPFGVDVAYADVIHGAPVELTGSDLFGFIGIEPVRIRAYPLGTHLAEKLHAYTLPRTRPNTRVKDLADMALLSTLDGLEAADLAAAIRATFAFRGTHAVPPALPDPPAGWVEPYRRLASVEGLPWPELVDVLEVARAFVDPVLGAPSGTWSSAGRSWI